MAKQRSIQSILQEIKEKDEERERLEAEIEQLEHQSNRIRNRMDRIVEHERRRRTHHLCNMGGAIEALSPEADALSREQFYELMKKVFALPKVQLLVQQAIDDDAAQSVEE